MNLYPIIGKLKNRVKNLFSLTSNNKLNSNDLSIKLLSIPGIGKKNCKVFLEAGYKTPESIFNASDKELLEIPGVGISFVKRLRKSQKV